jgi:hypothetical protein
MADDPFAGLIPLTAPAPGIGRPVIRKGVEPPKPDLPQGFAIGDTQPAHPIAGLPPQFTQPESWRTLSPKEIADRGLPAGGSYQISGKTGEIKPLGEPPKTALTAEDRDKYKRQLQGAIGLRNRLGEVQKNYDKYIKGAAGSEGSILGALGEYLPATARPGNGLFDDSANSLMGDIASAYGLTAQQQNTPTELKIRFGPLIPGSSDRDLQIEGKMQRIRDIADQQENAARQALGLPLRPGTKPLAKTAPQPAPTSGWGKAEVVK